MLVVIAALLAGPIGAQFLGIRSTWLRGWRMFAGQGLGMVQLDGEVWLRDGTRRALRVTDLGEVRPRAPKSRLVEPGREDAALRDVCRRVEGAKSVIARTRVAVREGWTAWVSRKRVDCPAKRTKGDQRSSGPPPALHESARASKADKEGS